MLYRQGDVLIRSAPSIPTDAKDVTPADRTAHEAVAWTFGLRGEEYHPALET